MDCLQAAVLVARAGSFSAAAEQLGVTHAAISRRVAGAETWAGMPLFSRHARGVALTQDGERVLARVAQGLDLLDRAADPGRKVRHADVVRLATTNSLAAFWLAPRLQALEAAAGGLRIEVATDGRLVNLSKGEADLALRYGDGHWRDTRAQALFESHRLIPVLSRDLAASLGATPGASDLVRLPLIHSGDSGPWRTWFAAHRIGFRGRPVDRVFGHHDVAMAAARAGLGVALAMSPFLPATPDRAWLRMDHLSCEDERHWYVATRTGERHANTERVIEALLGMGRQLDAQSGGTHPEPKRRRSAQRG